MREVRQQMSMMWYTDLSGSSYSVAKDLCVGAGEQHQPNYPFCVAQSATPAANHKRRQGALKSYNIHYSPVMPIQRCF